MGAGWFDAMGAGWSDSMGAGWSDSGGSRGGPPVFPMAPDSPLADEQITPLYFDAEFPKHAWDPDLYSLHVLEEFLKTGLNLTVPAYIKPTANDINEMLELAVTIRPQRLGEIIQQDKNFQTCWLQLLMMTRNSHPATYLLMKLAARVGEVSMIHCKLKNPKAGRPSQVCPTLYPPIPVAGHATYPAGHAMIGQLTTECLKEVMIDRPGHANERAGVRMALDKLAERVGFNRVVAGFHFRRDITVGIDISKNQVFPRLQGCATYQKVRTAAQAEWA